MTYQDQKHILFLTFEFPPAHGGGLSTYMEHACRALVEAGVQVTVVHPEVEAPKEGRLREAFGATVFEFNPYEHFAFKYMGHWPAMSYAVSDALAEAIRSQGMPDLVEACDGFALGYYAMQRKLTLEEPFAALNFVVTGHTPVSMIDKWEGYDGFKLPRYWMEVMEKWCFRAADQVDVPSRFLINKLQSDFGLADIEMHHVPNPYARQATGAALTKGDDTSEATQPQASRDYACVISRVTKWKGVPGLIAAFAPLWQAGETLQLRIYGSDTVDLATGQSMTEGLSQQYAQYVADGRLLFAGLAAPSELPQIRRQARFQIHPSENENFPYTVVEAMAAGTIPVVNRNGGQAELVEDGQSGFIYDATDPSSFAAAFARVMALTADENKAMRLAAPQRCGAVCSYGDYAARKLATLDRLKSVPARRHFPFVQGLQKIAAPQETATCDSANRLTVVIPYYNMQEFIHETLDSIYGSTISVDVILVNDGSTYPETDRVLDELRQRYPDLVILNKPNSGVADTRNKGVAAAKTEYVALLDADDVVTPDYYRQAIAVLDRYENVAFVGSWADDYNEDGTIRYWPTFSPEPPSQFLFNMVNAQALIYRRTAYLDKGQHDPDLKMYLDDWEGTINLLANGYRGVMIPHPLFRYRIRPDGIFKSGNHRWAQNYSYIIEKHAAAFADYAPEIAKFLNANGPNHLYHNPTFDSALEGSTLGQVSGGVAGRFAQGRLMRLAENYYRFMYETKASRSAHLARRILNVPFSLAFASARRVARMTRS